jgi:hypothetical protein
MKKLAIVAAVLALAALFSTCGLKKTSVDECIDNFMSDINGSDRSQVYTNLDSSSTMYGAARAGGYWNIVLNPIGIPFTLTSRSTSGSVVSATMNSSIYGGGTPITFDMSEDSAGNAVIATIDMPSALGKIYY